jgi:hypothetical protein
MNGEGRGGERGDGGEGEGGVRIRRRKSDNNMCFSYSNAFSHSTQTAHEDHSTPPASTIIYF